MEAVESLFECLEQVPDPRRARLTGVCMGFSCRAWQVISKLGLGSGHGSGSSHTRRQSLP